MAREIKRIVVHCSASSFGCRDVIDEWHKEKGWDGIGYHYVINNGRPHSGVEFSDEWDGKVETGRVLEIQGAHVSGHNADTVGICLIGTAEGLFRPRQIQELSTLIKWLQGQFSIPSGEVMGHRDLDSKKTCPGFDVRAWWIGDD